MKVVNWNVQWATPGSARSPEILCRIAREAPDIVCLTETDCRLLAGWDGFSISAATAPGDAPTSNRRKVALWSRTPWTHVDDFGNEELPKGRFVAGTTRGTQGKVSVIGVCIPWHNSNVNVGEKNKAPWEDHTVYLAGLSSILAGNWPNPLIVMGDFNQQIGQRARPYPSLSHPVRSLLQATMQAARLPGLTIATAALGLRGRRAIDHIAISGDLCARSLAIIDNMDEERRLSDHFGVVADLSVRDAQQNPQ